MSQSASVQVSLSCSSMWCPEMNCWPVQRTPHWLLEILCKNRAGIERCCPTCTTQFYSLIPWHFNYLPSLLEVLSPISSFPSQSHKFTIVQASIATSYVFVFWAFWCNYLFPKQTPALLLLTQTIYQKEQRERGCGQRKARCWMTNQQRKMKELLMQTALF